MAKKKIIIVSNRLPVSVKKVRGKLVFTSSKGGLAAGLSSIPKEQRLWIGWPGIVSDGLTDKEKDAIIAGLKKLDCIPVFLTRLQAKNFYEGYCNDTLWPLFHYFSDNVVYRRTYWESYQVCNQLFADVVVKQAGSASAIWIHDYHLMLLPSLLRTQLDNVPIGFFLHIPFPSFELFRLLPERREIMDGLLGADLIGFHTHDYVRHFLSCALILSGYDHNNSVLQVGSRSVRVDAFPIGIDTAQFETIATSKKTARIVGELAESLAGKKLILSVDRLDYTKGIPERLEAFNTFLRDYPDQHGKVVMLMIAVPSRTNVNSYKELRKNVEQLISRINGNYGTVDWMPIRYFFRNLPWEQLVPLYRQSDVAMVTPLRDGMNMVAKEFVAAQGEENPGVLILSETTGAATELHDALLINPHDRTGLAHALQRGLTLPLKERAERIGHMQNRLREYTVHNWAEDFMQQLLSHAATAAEQTTEPLTTKIQHELVETYKASKKRLLLLDYDGTLTNYTTHPEQGWPRAELKQVLTKLGDQPDTEVVVVSGRGRQNMEEWFGDLPVSLVAEHGACTRLFGRTWHCKPLRGEDWKPQVLALWEPFRRRTPGATIEQKEYSLVWHYRRVPVHLAKLRIQQLITATGPLAENLGLGLYQSQKALEIKQADSSKAIPVEGLLQRNDWNFVMAAGDDYTDEDIFKMLPAEAHTIKVGSGPTAASYRTPNPEGLLALLQILANVK